MSRTCMHTRIVKITSAIRETQSSMQVTLLIGANISLTRATYAYR